METLVKSSQNHAPQRLGASRVPSFRLLRVQRSFAYRARDPTRPGFVRQPAPQWKTVQASNPQIEPEQQQQQQLDTMRTSKTDWATFLVVLGQMGAVIGTMT
eukprot:771248-Pelagomonas_calceolata.AAC.2